MCAHLPLQHGDWLLDRSRKRMTCHLPAAVNAPQRTVRTGQARMSSSWIHRLCANAPVVGCEARISVTCTQTARRIRKYRFPEGLRVSQHGQMMRAPFTLGSRASLGCCSRCANVECVSEREENGLSKARRMKFNHDCVGFRPGRTGRKGRSRNTEVIVENLADWAPRDMYKMSSEFSTMSARR